jgi:hypothetical protein
VHELAPVTRSEHEPEADNREEHGCLRSVWIESLYEPRAHLAL